MELSPTAYVILGMLSWRPMSGYDIKAIVDRSTRFFWAASYGQIYPELRRLAEGGLIEAEGSEGGRRRTAYRLTGAGRKELRSWLDEQPDTYEMRDEALLKLFFASASSGATLRALEAKRARHDAIATELRAIEAAGKPEGSAGLVLRYGIDCNTWMAQWCEGAIAELGGKERKVA
jgi:DNA-binding PadR family transcriptional regulator